MPADAPADPLVISVLIMALFVWGAVIWWRLQFVASTEIYRQDRLPLVAFSVSEFLFLALLLLMGALAGGALANGLTHLLPSRLRTDSGFVTFWMGAGVDSGALFLLLIRKRLPEWVWPMSNEDSLCREPALAPPLNVKQIPLAGLLTYLAALPGIIAIQQAWFFILDRLHVEAPRQPLIDLMKGSHGIAKMILFVGLTVVIGPMIEEIVFRAGIFRGAKQVLPRWAAFLISSVIFATLHYNLSSFAPLVLFAYVLALSYERTGRIAVPMIAHGLFNLTSVILLLTGHDS